jgi:thiamine pyrophosphate-dependent acetolactate synthase large subunit-like protein
MVKSDGKISAAQAVVECLLREGIDYVWGIPGTQNLPLLDVLRETPEIRFILTRHEQGAAFMAYGFARAAGRPAVVTATEGPGITNLATGIAAAYKGYVPVISISGQQEERVRDRDGNQDIDQVTFFKPITKWAYSIPSADKAQEAVRRAFRTALAEPVGPVHLEASRDIFLEHTERQEQAPSAYRTAALPDVTPAAIDEAMALLSKAERPLFVVGGGVLREGITDAMMDLASRSGIPVATLQYFPDAFPTTHPLALGALGRNGWGSANKTAPKADVVVAIGAHIDYYSSTFRYGVFTPEQKIIHHNPVATDIGVVYPVAQALTGSTRSFVEGLSDRISRAGSRWEWLDVAQARKDWDAERFGITDPAKPVPGPFLARTMRAALPQNGVMVVDAGNAGKHVRPLYDTFEPGTFMSIDDWASVGGSFPIAMGAKVAQPQRPVMVTVGDMGMMCNIGELETAVRENIPVVCVVFNDNGLANERAYQNELYGGRFFAVDYGHVDFAALARNFGAHGERVEEPGDLEPALRRALDSNRPAVVDVLIDRENLAPVVFKP